MNMKRELSVVFLEVNEADQHFLDRYLAEDKLPTFRRMHDGGALVTTTIPGWTAQGDRSFREIMPWVIWPTLYTGIEARQHGILAFGQDTKRIRDKCVWDVLDRHGISIGVFGSLLSYPPRTHGHAKFYVPESLADDAQCFPEYLQPLQEFLLLGTRNYSENIWKQSLRGLKLLAQSLRCGVTWASFFKVLTQIHREILLGAWHEPQRALLHSCIMKDAFMSLYRTHRPRYASIHMNHVAYMQHRYWRAAEPKKFPSALSETDARFFQSPQQRDLYEKKHEHRILQAYQYTDALLFDVLNMVADNTIVLVGTGLGQMPINPVTEIHNPVVRLMREYEFFDALGLCNYRVLHQMNPDLTVTFANDEAARQAQDLLVGLYVHEGTSLFHIDRCHHQLSLEFVMPRGLFGKMEGVVIRHRERSEIQFPFARHVSQHPTNDQSTAQHRDRGWLLAYCKGRQVGVHKNEVSVTEIAPAILNLFGIAPQPWHQADGKLFELSEFSHRRYPASAA
jgi:hypothetical protein